MRPRSCLFIVNARNHFERIHRLSWKLLTIFAALECHKVCSTKMSTIRIGPVKV